MNITLPGIGVGAKCKSTASARTVKSGAKQKDAQASAPKRDRVELQFTDLLQAEDAGFIEVNGRRFTVSDDMAVQMRAAYDEMLARNEKYMEYQAAADNAKAAEQRLKALKDYGDAMKKAFEIARRIAKGGRVPPQDAKFLADYSQEMYTSAKIQGMTAKEHKKYDSVLDEDDQKPAGEGATPDDGDDGDSGRTRAVAEVTLSEGAVSGVSVGEAPVSA